MAMVLDEEQSMLRDAARGFLTDHAPVSQLRKLRDSGNEDKFDRATWAAMGEMGWAGVLVDEDHGGVDMGFQAAGLIAEEMGRTLTASPYLSTAMMGATALGAYGTTSQKETWLPKIATGEAIMAIAVDEGRKHRPQQVATTASKSGNGFKISGTKTFVADGGVAEQIIVTARTAGGEGEKEGISLFLVSADAAGITKTHHDMIDSRNSVTLSFDDVEVDGDAIIGEIDGGASPLNHILNAGRAGLAAEMSGSAQACLSMTVDYLKERKQFGKTIGEFQALQHRASHLYSEIELAKAVVMKALQGLDSAPEHASLMVAAAKAKLGQVAQLAAQESIQMHGGIGMTDEYDIGFYMKRIRVAEALYGDSHYQADIYAKLRGF